MIVARLFLETPADAGLAWIMLCIDGLYRSYCEAVTAPWWWRP